MEPTDPSSEAIPVSKTAELLGPPLDHTQLRRIESVHRGFLYQHLYAVACLLTCGRQAGNVVIVERDEDVEFATPESRSYAQVKTRSRPLQFGDIKDALLRFDELRREHIAGNRVGTPAFKIVTNVEPSSELADIASARDWPSDVRIVSPSRVAEGLLPPAWSDIDSAIRWCSKAAADVPFGALAPETLVWKLAATVHYAASGARDHKFSAEDLPALLEQLLIQLQDFPDPPADYRPQLDEPPLVTDAPVRLLTGFSGAGKTAWASQAAMHCPEPVAYYDVGDIPVASVANGLARELAARFAGGRKHGLGGAMLAESAGVDVLRACAAELDRQGLHVTVVVDNAHRMTAEAIRIIVDAASKQRFFFIGQPWDGQTAVEALFGLRAEHLAGWTIDTIAAEFKEAGCPVSVETAERVLRMTGGLPLYVRSSALLAMSGYQGKAVALCDAIESCTHTQETAQEVILEQTFARLGAGARSAAGLLSYSDVPLSNDEAVKYLSSLASSAAEAAQALRELRRASIIIGYQGDRIGLHDALRPLAGREAATLARPKQEEALHRLYALLVASLKAERNIPRLNTVLRLLPKIGRAEALVDLATDEMFHEQGDQRTLRAELEKAARDRHASFSERYWAHDALAYWESRDGGRPDGQRLSAMRKIVDDGNLGTPERLGLCFKQLAAAGYDGDRQAVDRAFAEGERLAEGNSLNSRLLRYNRAIALHRAGAHREVLAILEPLIQEYYAAIGLREADVFMKSHAALYKLLPKPIDQENLKRLGDALATWATTRVELKQPPMLRRIQAAKFYRLAQAGRSAAAALHNCVDDFIEIGADPVGARQIMEDHLLPLLKEFGLNEMILPVRSHYAIVLAWCGEVADARREVLALSAYGDSPEQKTMLAERARAVEDIAAGRIRLRRQTPPPDALRSIPGALAFVQRKVGRNAPCPCGSNRKYKYCHGR